MYIQVCVYVVKSRPVMWVVGRAGADDQSIGIYTSISSILIQKPALTPTTPIYVHTQPHSLQRLDLGVAVLEVGFRLGLGLLERLLALLQAGLLVCIVLI